MSKNNNIQFEKTKQLYAAAVSVAAVAVLFVAIVLTFIVLDYYRYTAYSLRMEEKLHDMKLEILSKPQNNELISEIRQLDLKIRQDRIRHREFIRKGSYLLLAGLVVFFVSGKSAFALKKKISRPKLPSLNHDEQSAQAVKARLAIVAAAILLLCAAVFICTKPEVTFDQNQTAGASDIQRSSNWPRFRGPGGLGTCDRRDIPLRFNRPTGKGILWKSAISLPGHNSPILWGNKLFLTGADEHRREVYCFDCADGKGLWTAEVKGISGSSTERIEVLEDTGYAASTAATNGRGVFAIFANGDLACFNFDGKKIWACNLGVPESTYGYASSLAIYRNLLLVQYDQAEAQDARSKLIAFDTSSGRTVWQVKRPVPNSWTSPIIADVQGRDQLITAADPWVIAYDPADGREIWRADCLGSDVAPSPVYSNGLVFAVNPNTDLVAIRTGGSGDVTGTHIAWVVHENIPDITSPLSDGRFVYLVTTFGMLTCYSHADGTKVWERELEMNFHASPTLVDDRIYLLSQNGVMLVLRAGNKYEELARSSLNENCHASPAFSDGKIYIRGERNLYCITGYED
ncbi:MAG: PQQ-binding-like beta-propeller repeat protein [Planctomycetota bacterium]